MNTTSITLAGKARQLTFDKHALARFGQQRGTFTGLFDDGQRYFTILLLAWASAEPSVRQDYSEPVALASEIEPDDEEKTGAILSAAKEAGWLQGLEKTLKQFVRSES
ncbi:MAG: hypothetical protein ACPGSB_03495 [Opitutales bacterium]